MGRTGCGKCKVYHIIGRGEAAISVYTYPGEGGGDERGREGGPLVIFVGQQSVGTPESS